MVVDGSSYFDTPLSCVGRSIMSNLMSSDGPRGQADPHDIQFSTPQQMKSSGSLIMLCRFLLICHDPDICPSTPRYRSQLLLQLWPNRHGHWSTLNHWRQQRWPNLWVRWSQRNTWEHHKKSRKVQCVWTAPADYRDVLFVFCVQMYVFSILLSFFSVVLVKSVPSA